MGRGPDGPAANPGFQLWHAAMRWRQAIGDGLAPLEITHTQFFLLGSLKWLSRGRPEGPNQREVAEHVGLDAMTTSQVLRTLEQRGLVKRREDPDDLRAYRLALTKKGSQVAEEALDLVHSSTEKFFAPLGKDLPKLVISLRKLSLGAGASEELVGKV